MHHFSFSHSKSFFCSSLHVGGACWSIRWKMTHYPHLVVKAADNSYFGWHCWSHEAMRKYQASLILNSKFAFLDSSIYVTQHPAMESRALCQSILFNQQRINTENQPKQRVTFREFALTEFVFHLFTAEAWANIIAAVDEIQKKSCIRFRMKEDGDDNWIYIAKRIGLENWYLIQSLDLFPSFCTSSSPVLNNTILYFTFPYYRTLKYIAWLVTLGLLRY